MMITAIQYLHLLAAAISVGAIVFVDIIFVRKTRKIRRYIDLVKMCSKTIIVCLCLLWLTGGLMIALEPALLDNQKVWGKVLVVFVVTVNGFAIEKLVIPYISDANNNYNKVSLERLLALFSVTLSLVGWLMALFLGMAEFPNNSVAFTDIMIVFVKVITVVYCCSFAVMQLFFTEAKPSQ